MYCFSNGPVVNIFTILHFKVCLSVHLNICLGHKSRKDLSNVMRLGYVFHVNNLCSYTKCCDCVLDQGHIKIFFESFFGLSFKRVLQFPYLDVIYYFKCMYKRRLLFIVILIKKSVNF